MTLTCDALMLLEIFVQTFEADGYFHLNRVQPLMHALSIYYNRGVFDKTCPWPRVEMSNDTLYNMLLD